MYVYVAVLIAGLVAGFGGGWNVQKWRWEASEGRAATNAQAQARLQRQGANAGAQAHEVDKAAIQTKFQTITQEVEHVVTRVEYRDRCVLPDDGVRILNEAIRATGDSGEPSHPVPATPASR